ncbi:hypothetical protein HDV06_006280 [Boothiomyces sp. JEL0866]|nr:hypothetical protein HDV06_006737 [Boothiomyces sp. JEL0866]KAJ3319470.1 hypothetical protein HDV06_006280 [Boothiomyces sp. JEL0866]
MGSDNDHNTDPEKLGVIPRCINELFDRLGQDNEYVPVLKVSFVEIYQEQVITRFTQIRDLLSTGNSIKEISVRESKEGSIILNGVHEQVVNNVEELEKCLEIGGMNRTTGDTQMNQLSSRSHAIFTITLEQMAPYAEKPDTFNFSENNESVVVRRSKLQLVDLAGSERLKRTGAEGVRLKESVKINSGLLALGNVKDQTKMTDRITFLTEIPNSQGIAYLMRLLQDSLGGNSQTIMIACVSPLLEDMDESINTMKYAYRARKIQNKPVLNIVDQIAMERTTMQNKIDQLEGKLRVLEVGGESPVKIQPEMIDFDNDQWMQFFMDQLKNRTIRGTNAIKALESVKKENEELKSKLMELEVELDDSQNKSEKTKQSQETIEKDLRNILTICAKLVSGDQPTDEDYEDIGAILSKYNIETGFRSSQSTVSLPTCLFPPINNQSQTITRAPSSNSHARQNRRKRIGSEDYHLVNDDAHLKPLEMELRETRKCLAQMEDELARTKTQLLQSEAVSEQSSKEITRLMELNEMIREGQTIDEKREIMSIKVLNETATQTVNQGTDEHETYPIHSSRADELNAQTEKYVEDLNLATKAKVDLLKELSKLNKESEKMRHQHLDQIQKLEREIGSLQGELVKVKDELVEKETQKDKIKEEYERKLKLHESANTKLKQKQKDLERTLKDKGSGDRRLQESQQEVEKLTSQIAALKKKAKEDHDKLNELETRRSKETAILNKQYEDEAKKSRHLEVKVEMIRKKLDRKTEEISILTKKVKDQSILASNASVKSFKHNEKSVDDHHDEVSTQYTSLENSTDIEYSKKNTEHDKIHSELQSARMRVEEIELKLQNEQLTDEETEALKSEKSRLILQIAQLRSEIKQSHEDPSQDFSSFKPKFESEPEILEIISQVPNANKQQQQSLIHTLLERLSGMKQELESNESLSKERIGELSSTVEKLEKRTQKIINTYEKQLALAREKQIETNSVVSQTEGLTDPKAESLVSEKDVFYYKNANKELKTKLREVVAVNHRLAKTLKERNQTQMQAEIPFPVAVEQN